MCKNSAWTLGALPVIITMISNNQRINVIGVILSLASRRALYYARAMTEEMHLSQDPDYVAYRKQVKYKYIP